MPGKQLVGLELCVTLAVSQLGDGAYGAAIRKEIQERTGRPVSIGALYTTISRLSGKGLLEVRPTEVEPGRVGRPRKYCSLTPAGVRATRHAVVTLGRMTAGLDFSPRAVDE